MNMGLFWLILLIAMIVIEVITLDLVTIWFAGGALLAFLADFLGLGLIWQFGIFLVVSLALLVLTRPIAKKYLEKGRISTNAESLIGESGIVTEDIDNVKATGAVSIRGLEWTARSFDKGLILRGSKVDILEIQGVKLIVKKKAE